MLTVGGLVISATAECPDGDGFSVLPGATVQLFSGSALVGTTAADGNGQFSFPGAATGALYQLRYTSSPHSGARMSCGTTADTATGVKIPPPPQCQDQSWDTAAVLTTAGSTDSICKPNQSIWRKIAVQPGQQVSIVVQNAGPKTRVALFKDLRQDLQNLLSNPGSPDLRQLDASMNGEAGAPWNSSPWNSSPWNSSPWNSSPGTACDQLACRVQPGRRGGLCQPTPDYHQQQRNLFAAGRGHALQEYAYHVHRVPHGLPLVGLRRHCQSNDAATVRD